MLINQNKMRACRGTFANHNNHTTTVHALTVIGMSLGRYHGMVKSEDLSPISILLVALDRL